MGRVGGRGGGGGEVCFVLWQEQELKAKLTALQLCNDGNKRVSSVLARGGWRGLQWSRLEAREGLARTLGAHCLQA
jgi:hypothetical protein